MSNKQKGPGRPKLAPEERRSFQFSVLMRPGDVDRLDTFCRDYGWKSRSHLVAYLVEATLSDGFSGLSGLKTCLAIQKQCQEANPALWRQGKLDFGQLVRGVYPIPDEFLTEEELIKEVSHILTELKTQHDNT